MRVGSKPQQHRYPVRPLWAQYDAAGLRLAFVYSVGSEARNPTAAATTDQSTATPTPNSTAEPGAARSFSAAASTTAMSPFSATPTSSTPTYTSTYTAHKLVVLQLHPEDALAEAAARRAGHSHAHTQSQAAASKSNAPPQESTFEVSPAGKRAL